MGLGLKEARSPSPASYLPSVWLLSHPRRPVSGATFLSARLSPRPVSLCGATLVLLSGLHISQLPSLEHDTATTYLQCCPAPQVSTLRPPFHFLQEAFPDHPAVQASGLLLVHSAHLPATALCPLDNCRVLTHCHLVR